MKKITYFLVLLVAGSAAAQEDCNLQYDGNGDGAVNVEDVLGVLSEFAAVCADTTDDGSNFLCGESLEYYGYTYDLVAIGNQCWFAENLRSSMYSNGDSIPRPIEDSEWQNATDNEVGAYAVYDNDGTWFTMYGSLYNWYAVTDPRGLCPIGWHVPSDSEWMILEMNLGLDSLEANQYGWRGTDQGTQMKSSSEDSPSWDGTNTSGFSALPGGFRDDDGPYDSVGENGRYWTTDASTEINSFGRRLQTSENRISRISSRRHGFSVRCLKD